MKVSKIPQLGDIGRIITDFEWDEPEAYDELAKLNKDTMLTFVKGDGKDKFDLLAKNTNRLLHRRFNRFILKYETFDYQGLLTDMERGVLDRFKDIAIDGAKYPGWHRVTGKVNELNRPMGIFGDTELLWHSNEFKAYDFAPVAILYGAQNMSRSSTSFVQTVDWFESQTEAFKSELCDMVSICYQDGKKIIPNGRPGDIEMVESVYDEKTFRMPLIIDSPNGRRGLHYANFVTRIEGMSHSDSEKLLNKIKDEIFNPDKQFDFWWEHDVGDMIVFDNSTCLHMRKLDQNLDMTSRLHERIGHRVTGDHNGYEDYNCFIQEEFRAKRQITIDKITDKWQMAK
jgi:alpha-ketoglutarate-dependent taurine dioxygenase